MTESFFFVSADTKKALVKKKKEPSIIKKNWTRMSIQIVRVCLFDFELVKKFSHMYVIIKIKHEVSTSSRVCRIAKSTN